MGPRVLQSLVIRSMTVRACPAMRGRGSYSNTTCMTCDGYFLKRIVLDLGRNTPSDISKKKKTHLDCAQKERGGKGCLLEYLKATFLGRSGRNYGHAKYSRASPGEVWIPLRKF